jgi:peptidoglycan/LPS O-acetylase OafA/YrhL
MTLRMKLRFGMMLLAVTIGFCGAIYSYAAIYDGTYGPNAVVAFLAVGLLVLTMPATSRRRRRRRRRAGSSSRNRNASDQEAWSPGQFAQKEEPRWTRSY